LTIDEETAKILGDTVKQSLVYLLGSAGETFIELLERQSRMSWISLTRDPDALSRALQTISGNVSKVIERVILKEFALRMGVAGSYEARDSFPAAVTKIQEKAKSRQ
jgi:hypothetical protein